MAATLPNSSVSSSVPCLPPQLPLLSLRETVAKINMPSAVVQASVMNQQMVTASTSVPSEAVYNLTLSNGEIHTVTSSALPKIAGPSVAAINVPQNFRSDIATSLANQKPIIVTVSGMAGMTKQVQLTSATNVLTAPLLSAPVHMVAQHFTTDKLPSSSGIVTLPTIPRPGVGTSLISTKSPRQITPLLPGSLITSKGQLMIASANSPLMCSSGGSVITTMSAISLNSTIVTVTPVIMTSTAPLVSIPANSAMTLNQVSQGQILSTMIQQNIKPVMSVNKTIVPATFLKPMNIAANPAQFPVAMQQATLAPAAIAIAPAPPQQPPPPQNPMPAQIQQTMTPVPTIPSVPVSVMAPGPVSAIPPVPVSAMAPIPMSAISPVSVSTTVPAPAMSPVVTVPVSPVSSSSTMQHAPVQEMDVDPKCDPKNPDFDPIQAMEWKDGIATLPGSNLKFKLNEFGILEMITEDLCSPIIPNPSKDEVATVSEDSSSESRQKRAKNKEMYKDETIKDQVTQNGTKDPSMSEELCRCENCDCFGLKIEFCKSGRFCSQSCASSFSNKKTTWLKRGAAKEKMKKKKLKVEHSSDSEVKKEPPPSDDASEVKKEVPECIKKDFSWETYMKSNNGIPAPAKLFKENQTFPSHKNKFLPGMKLEGIDPRHPSLFCVLSVSEIRGYRVRLHFDGYSECYDFWINADSPDIFPIGWCEKNNHKLQPPKGFTRQEFDWDHYLKLSKAEAAPEEIFAITHKHKEPANPNFKIGMKLEAVDKKNSSLVCVATIIDAIDNRFLIHFDGWEDIYDYWADPSSPHLHPINWCRENDRKLTPPKEFKDNSAFNWTKYLTDTRSIAVANRAFKICPPNEFKPGMKLEAVDRRNPILIRVAMIADRNDHSLLIHFDGWSNVYDYWVDDNNPDLHPINWCAKTGHPLEPPIVTSPGQPGPCPTAGCLGQGHIKGPKYTTHHSAFGCPYSQINLNKLDNGCQDRVIITKESLHEFIRRPSESGGATDGLRRCPTPGCNGVGHVKGKYSVHHRVSGCPLAEKNALKIQQQQKELQQQKEQQCNSASSSPTPTPSQEVRAVTPPPPIVNSSKDDSKSSLDSLKSKNGIGRGKKKLKFPGTGMRGRPPKHLTAMRLEAMKKAREITPTTEKKNSVEDKVHDSIFSVPFTNPPKEVPLAYEHNTAIIPGLSSIKGSAVRQWSVNQVAKFVSSLKGCIDQGKLFREQLIDGEALLLLNQSDLLDVLHMRLGPALKVYSSIIAFRESEKFA